MKNWDTLLVPPTASIEHAMSILDKGAEKIVLVVDEHHKLLGTVTDGDLRRSLLKHISMSSPVHSIMNASPKTAPLGSTRQQILTILEQYGLMQLPIVNDQGCVVGLEVFHELLKTKRHDNPVLLLAGGFGTRLLPLTEDCPKPLLKIGEKPILELILERLIEAGFHQVYISIYFMPERIKDYFGDGSRWGISISYLQETTPLGTGGALSLLPHAAITLPILVMNADLLTMLSFQSLLDFHREHAGLASVCVRKYEHQVPFGVVLAEGDRVRSITEKPVHHFFINAGIYLIDPVIARHVSPATKIDMPDILNHYVEEQRSVHLFPIHEYWLDIGRMNDFQRAQHDIGALV